MFTKTFLLQASTLAIHLNPFALELSDFNKGSPDVSESFYDCKTESMFLRMFKGHKSYEDCKKGWIQPFTVSWPPYQGYEPDHVRLTFCSADQGQNVLTVLNSVFGMHRFALMYRNLNPDNSIILSCSEDLIKMRAVFKKLPFVEVDCDVNCKQHSQPVQIYYDHRINDPKIIVHYRIFYCPIHYAFKMILKEFNTRLLCKGGEPNNNSLWKSFLS